jgi:hypothetical protein
MAELTDRQKKVLEKLKAAIKEADAVPASQKRPISNPEKYAPPIGLDEEGNYLPNKPPKHKMTKRWPKDTSSGLDSDTTSAKE